MANYTFSKQENYQALSSSLNLFTHFCSTNTWVFPFLPSFFPLSSHHTLSEVFLSLAEVDLSDNKLGDEGAKAIADMLKENGSLVLLKLSGNNFTDRSAEHISPALITNTKLQHLDLSHNALGERAGEGDEAISKS